MSTAAKPANCDAEFTDLIMSGHFPSLQSKIQHWESLGKKCAGSGIYESRLGVLYTQAGDFNKARDALNRGLALKSEYERNLRVALADLSFRQSDLATSEKEATQIIKDFPDWAGGYMVLGETYLVKHRLEESIQNLEKSNSLEPSGPAYVLLTMAYYTAHRPRDSAKAMQTAIKLDETSLEHTQAVCAAAYSLVQLGFVPEAGELLAKHLEIKPGAADDPTFRQATAAVQSRLGNNGTRAN